MKRIMSWLRNRRINRAKFRILNALQNISEYDEILRRAGSTRPERRQFWRDIVKHPEMATKIASAFKEVL